ncbi:COG4705 family protein [Paenibacillus aestuarii]|uniref:Membrane-anchored protein n=1 Tax=Paenibacillus aestuarii TaxID=516965 RepID=A0ABW0KGW0_9BACL|nr:hypothetical protein [Paenibacillus aestuarii]
MELNQSKLKILLNKVPQVTIFFWIIKVLCTTVGETFADFINFNLGFGLSVTTIIMGLAFFFVLIFQFKATKYVPSLYWLTVVLISVFGTLVTDNLTDNIGVPLEVSTIVFSVLLGVVFLLWYLSEKTLSIHSIYTRKREVYYWLTILFTFALGTAVGDLFSEQLGLGYLNTGLAVLFINACVFLAWKYLKLDGILAFWIAYILTRPLGASLGDYLSQPKANGALGLGTTVTSIIFLLAILVIIVFLAVTKLDVTVKNEMPQTDEPNRNKKNVLTQTIAVLCIFLVVGIGGYIELSNHISSTSTAASSQSIGSDNQSQANKLAGQLTDFIKIENDMLNNIASNDFASAKKGADDLEHQWDAAEPKLRKLDGKAWTQIDGTVDIVLAATRSSSPDASKSKAALNNSLGTLNDANHSAATQNDSSPTPTPAEKSQTEASTEKGKSQDAASHNKLAGQLTDFIKIENDMLNDISSNDFAAVKKGADDLEHQWDTSEPKLRKADGKTWTQIDGTIDVVLAAARSSKFDTGKSISAIYSSLAVLKRENN